MFKYEAFGTFEAECKRYDATYQSSGPLRGCQTLSIIRFELHLHVICVYSHTYIEEDQRFLGSMRKDSGCLGMFRAK